MNFMGRQTGPIVLAGVLALAAAAPATATHPELACGHFALTEPLVLPRDALVVGYVSLRADDVVLNGECVSHRARVRRRARGGARFIAIFRDCGEVRRIKIRGRTDRECARMRGRLVARGPAFRSRFEAVAISEHGCGAEPFCAPGSFCALPPGVCGTDLAAGACVAIPDGCRSDIPDPVCGCDGVTYLSECERRQAGVSKSHDGICETDGCRENSDCDGTEYCAKEYGDCDGLGICLVRPAGCIDVDSFACGCDGHVYANGCWAANAGVSLADGSVCLRCGTIAGLPCPDGLVCDLEAGMCGVADLGGTCVPKADACPEIYAPVCGCDGVTYGNDCERIAAGAQKDRDGICECEDIRCPPDTLPVDRDGDGCPDECINVRCETNADCPDDRWCASELAQDCTSPGICLERPLGCPDVWLPVCGCDGQTYSNDCDAAAAGVRVAHEGTCLCEPPICPDGTRPHDRDGDGCDDVCVPIVGCAAGDECPTGTYCRFERGICGGDGTCEPLPDACPAVVDPVCGCDGHTYSNACEAARAGVSLAHRGACAPTCGTIAGIPCPEGMFCDLDPGTCLVADAGGTCVPVPEVCPELYAPVCGCDGVTYGNDCERIAAAVTKDHDGACCTGVCCPPWSQPYDTNHDGCPDTCAIGPCYGICGDDGCTFHCPDSCETACDCYAKAGTSFCEACPLLCPNCGEHWQCLDGHCVEVCGPLPADVIGCLNDTTR
jgi:hypothetical protein